MGGVVEGIFWGAVDHEPLKQADEVKVVTGAGIEGDRYGHRDITLFEAEAIEGLREDTGIELGPERDPPQCDDARNRAERPARPARPPR
jgi:hypothetical protein